MESGGQTGVRTLARRWGGQEQYLPELKRCQPGAVWTGRGRAGREAAVCCRDLGGWLSFWHFTLNAIDWSNLGE